MLAELDYQLKSWSFPFDQKFRERNQMERIEFQKRFSKIWVYSARLTKYFGNSQTLEILQ